MYLCPLAVVILKLTDRFGFRVESLRLLHCRTKYTLHFDKNKDF